MNEILFHYEQIAPTTWVYLASLLIIGLFFKFGRFWSVRNLDLLLLILLAPGLLLVSEGQEVQRAAMAELSADNTFSTDITSPADNPVDRSDRQPEVVEDPEAAPSAPSAAGDSDSDGSISEDNQISEDRQNEDRNGRKVRSSDRRDDEESEVPLTPAHQDLLRGQTLQRVGFIWLLLAGLALLVRLLVDPTMVRRPLLEPNLTTGGLTFSCCSLFVFLMANIVASHPTADDLAGPISAERLLSRQASDDLDRHGPGYALMFALPSLPTARLGSRPHVDEPSVRFRTWKAQTKDDSTYEVISAEFLDISRGETVRLKRQDGTELSYALSELSDEDQAFVRKVRAYTAVAKLAAVFSHLAIVVGIIAIGYWHFHNVKMGIGSATLYLMLPYTSQMTGRVDHALPAALLVWALLTYRRPLVSGLFMGLAIGVIYYPLFLLPLWFSFYWRRGLLRFAVGLVTVLTIMVICLAFISADVEAFWQCIKKMFGLTPPQTVGLGGIWGLGWAPVYRYPVLAAFVALCGSLAIWPAQKNLGTLLSCTAAIMVATQFWHGFGGGLYMAWYLPPLLLTVFRPNLEDRTALSVVNENWLPPRWSIAA